jgi:hypothetical protein
MKAWVRAIPTPGYGNYGGAKRRCKAAEAHTCPIPIDWMDTAFMMHDIRLNESNSEEDDEKADRKLGEALRAGNPRKLKHKVYGRLFRRSAMLFFKEK